MMRAWHGDALPVIVVHTVAREGRVQTPEPHIGLFLYPPPMASVVLPLVPVTLTNIPYLPGDVFAAIKPAWN